MVRPVSSRGGRLLLLPNFVVVLLVLVLAACGPSGATAPPGTGIRGTITLGPTCPVEQVGQPPCVEPYAATLVVTSAEDGSVVARVDSAADGTFQVDLPPGAYVINPEPGGDPFPFGKPVDVTVVAGAYTQVEVAYDTGIR